MNLTFQTAVDLFLNEKEATVPSMKTMSYYENSLRYFGDFIKQEFARPLNEIQVAEVGLNEYQSYVKYLKHRDKLVNHPFKPKSDGPITFRSIRTYTSAIKIFYRFLFENEYIAIDVAKRIKLIKSEEKVIVALFRDEVASIDALYNEKCMLGLRNLIIVHLMLDMGFRTGDVVGLDIDDIYFEKRFIYLKNGKGSKDRVVPLPANLKKWLFKYIHFFRKDIDSGIVLQTDEGKDITYDVIKMLNQRIKKKTGIIRLKPHLLRHSFATCYTAAGGNIELLRVYLGHADIKITQHYVQSANTYRMLAEGNMYQLDKIFFRNFRNYN